MQSSVQTVQPVHPGAPSSSLPESCAYFDGTVPGRRTKGGARSECGRAVRDEGRLRLRDPMGQRELKLRGLELLDVRPAHVFGLLNLHNTEDLSMGEG